LVLENLVLENGIYKIIMKKLKDIDKFSNFIVSYNYFYNNVSFKTNLKISDIISFSDWAIFDELVFLIGFTKLL
jgi:hypothetical protein